MMIMPSIFLWLILQKTYLCLFYVLSHLVSDESFGIKIWTVLQTDFPSLQGNMKRNCTSLPPLTINYCFCINLLCIIDSYIQRTSSAWNRKPQDLYLTSNFRDHTFFYIFAPLLYPGPFISSFEILVKLFLRVFS